MKERKNIKSGWFFLKLACTCIHQDLFYYIMIPAKPATTDSAKDCSAGMDECNEVVMGWTVGVYGDCYDERYGTRIGEGGYTGLMIEVRNQTQS